MSSRSVRIIIPAHNEADRLEGSVGHLFRHFGSRATILVVANGCSDSTADVTRSLARRYPTVELLEIVHRIGKGGAVRAGLTFGSEPYVAFVDADGSTSPEQLDALLQACNDRKLSGAIGSRWLPASRIARKQSLQRRLASRTFNRVTRLFFGLPYTDTQCGAKVFERAAIDGILDRLEIANFAFDVDLLLELKRVGKPATEIAISWDDVAENSKVRLFRSGAPMLGALLRLFIRESVLGRLPFLDTFGRSHTIPVVCGFDVLIFVSRVTGASSRFRAIVEGMRVRGHGVHVVRTDDPLALARFAFWYLRAGHRQSDAIVHEAGPVGTHILNLSSKPKYSLEALEDGADDPATLDDFVRRIAADTHRPHYFSRTGEGWTLAAQRLEPTTIDRMPIG